MTSSLLLLVCRMAIIAMPPNSAHVGDDHRSAATPTRSVAVSDATEAEVNPSKQTLSDYELDELESIRRQLSPLRGTLFEDEEFGDQLRADFGRRPPGRSQPVAAPRGTADAYRQQSLRSIARRLSVIAEDLEALDMHDAANGARQLRRSVQR